MTIKQVFNTSADLDYPSVLPTLDLDFVNNKTLDPRITFTRSSGGTYVGPDGLIKYAGVNEPRFDHDPVTGESLGLLIEESRSNFIRYSQLYPGTTFPYWNRIIGQATITYPALGIIAPDGTTTAIQLRRDSSSGIAAIAQDSFTILSPSTTYTFSLYVKSGNSNIVGIEVGSGPNNSIVSFNITSKIFTESSTSGNVSSIQNVNYQELKDGWIRLFFSITTSASWSGATNLAIYESTFVSGNFYYFWGVQLEQGSFPTSYIPTLGSTRTRAPDRPIISGTNFSSWYNNNNGTILVTYKGGRTNNYPDGYGRLATTSSFSLENGGNAFSKSIGASGGYNNFISPVNAYTSFAKVAVSWSNAELRSLVSDKISATSIPFPKLIPAVPTQISIGWDYIANNYGINGYISKFTFYPQRLPNTQLQALTI